MSEILQTLGAVAEIVTLLLALGATFSLRNVRTRLTEQHEELLAAAGNHASDFKEFLDAHSQVGEDKLQGPWH